MPLVSASAALIVIGIGGSLGLVHIVLLDLVYCVCFISSCVQLLKLSRGNDSHYFTKGITCLYLLCLQQSSYHFPSQSNMRTSVSELTDSVPTTQSPKRGGDYRAMASSQGVLSESEKREKEGGF